jgi:hypothetical protein
MRFLGLFLLFAEAAISASITDLWHRGAVMVHYTVYPIDSGDAIATTEIEASLKDLDTNVNITPTREGDLLITWSIISIRSDLQDSIIAIKGVRHVERNISPHASATTKVRRSSELPRREIGSYMCLAKNPSEAEEIEKWLRTKIQPDQGKRINQMVRRNKVVGWAGLVLDDSARAEVEDHPGLQYFREDLETHQDRARAPESWPQPGLVTPRTANTEKEPNTRSGTWVKQADADAALAVDSQYP